MNIGQKILLSETTSALAVNGLTVHGSDGFTLNVPDLTIKDGSIVAIIGANGSGKTSFLEAILGLRKVTAGEATFGGRHLNSSVRKELGVYLQTVNFEPSMLVREILALHASLYDHAEDGLRETLGIAELEKKTFERCSTGQRQRVGIYLALASQPKLSILDEPTSGLDASGAAAFRRHLAKTDWRTSQRTCVIVTHNNVDARLAQRVIWLHQGRVVGDGPLDLLISRHLGPRHFVLADLTAEQHRTISQLIPQGVVVRETFNVDRHTIHIFGGDQFEREMLLKLQGERSLNYTASETGAEDLVLFSKLEAVQ